MAVERLAIFEFYKLGRCQSFVPKVKVVTFSLLSRLGTRDQLTMGLFWAAVSSDSGSCRRFDDEKGWNGVGPAYHRGRRWAYPRCSMRRYVRGVKWPAPCVCGGATVIQIATIASMYVYNRQLSRGTREIDQTMSWIDETRAFKTT